MLTHKGSQTIETQRLVLRRAVMEDAQPFFDNWASDSEVTRFLTWQAHDSLDVTKSVLGSWIEGYKRDDFYQWMIVPKDLGVPIGTISVVDAKDSVGKAEVGYCLGKAWWHKGIMTEALRGVMGYLFDEIGYNRIEARHDSRNPHSGDVMKKCGMVYEGTARQAGRNNQGICDICNYAMLAEDRCK